MSFSNLQLEIKDLPQWEAVQFQPISKRYLTVIIINYVIVWFFILLAAGIVIFNTEDISKTNGLIFGVSVTALFLFFIVMSVLAFKKRGYAIREKDVLYKAGLLGFHTVIIPYKHIQHVKVKESFISRMFKLVTLEMYTAGAGRNMLIQGLERDEAERLQQFIVSKITDESEAN
ncbi:PH domain-containing protein [Sphingobacterium hungaricum]|nr:PH domain-containing protein [Sphingobacterium hungaricum]